jgi:hypothetical protein
MLCSAVHLHRLQNGESDLGNQFAFPGIDLVVADGVELLVSTLLTLLSMGHGVVRVRTTKTVLT